LASIPPRVWVLAAVVLALAGCFGVPLYDLVRYAAPSELYSHILLIPFISLYLIWLRRGKLALDSAPARRLAWFPAVTGLAALGGFWLGVSCGWRPAMVDYLAWMTFSFLAFLVGAGFLLLGLETLRRIAFPLAFLAFMIPFPTVVRGWIDTFFQYGSAEAARACFWAAGMPVEQQGLVFQLPGTALQIAEECSGIHSSLVLFITSLLAGHLLLRSASRRALLALAVVPLALLRNGFRVFVIGELCVNISPRMIDSPIHHQGGPLFFVLSLVPFSLLLFFLRRCESRHRKRRQRAKR